MSWNQGSGGGGGAAGLVSAGAGLVDSGSLPFAVFDVVASDPSVAIVANSLRVGVLQTDVQHGARGGGSQHPAATTSVDGFMSAADKVKLDGIPPTPVASVGAGAGLTNSGTASNPILDVIANADGSIVVAADDVRVGVINDTQHGERGGGSLHANVIAAGAAGFMTGADKTKLDLTLSGAPFLFGNGSVSGTNVTRYLTPGRSDALASTTPIQFRIPRAGALRNLRVRHNVVDGNGLAIVYTVRVNGVDSALLVSMASTASDGSDLTHTVTVAAGDLIDLKVTKAASIGASPLDVAATLEETAS